MNTPSLQAQFERNAYHSGVLLGLTYGGRWQLDPATKAVARASVSPASLQSFGFTSLKVSGSEYVRERVEKWGASFKPNATVLIPLRIPTANLVTIQDLRNPSAQAQEVILDAPATLSEGVYNMLWTRIGSPYNKQVTIVLMNDIGTHERVYATNVPARITFPSSVGDNGAGTNSDAPSNVVTTDSAPSIEMPLVYDGNGSLVTLDPSLTLIVDSPTVPVDGSGNPQRDGLPTYRLASSVAFPGGELHHCKYQIELEMN